MEKIKKTILQALAYEGVPCPSGITGPCEVIVPDLNAVYYMKINLTAELMDVGFLNAYVEPPPPPEPPIPPEPPENTYFLEDDNGDIFIDDYSNSFIYE